MPKSTFFAKHLEMTAFEKQQQIKSKFSKILFQYNPSGKWKLEPEVVNQRCSKKGVLKNFAKFCEIFNNNYFEQYLQRLLLPLNILLPCGINFEQLEVARMKKTPPQVISRLTHFQGYFFRYFANIL